MESEVEARRKKAPTSDRPSASTTILTDDVLDECEASFVAAQEKVTKASKNYYADTGLMALLCRHDRVLFLANMTTPGERQFTALALLNELDQNIPDNWHVGVLYDIGCQLARSVEKHNFIDHLAPRVIWAVSVFHAYGHQWACQLVFHPRKRKGFGLSDGEGCERFWSAIRRLIPVLRVTGENRRRFILDRQIEFLDHDSRWRCGEWIARRYNDCEQRMIHAEGTLKQLDISEVDIIKEWEAQLESQLKEKPRQSKDAGDHALGEIVVQLGRLEEIAAELKIEKAKMGKLAQKKSAREVNAFAGVIDRLESERSTVRRQVQQATSDLGVVNKRKLDELRGDAYLTARINARAMRSKIRAAVVAHKFERGRLERAYRRQILDNKEHTQARDVVQRGSKGITADVRRYNLLVKQIDDLIRKRAVPNRRIKAPRALDAKKLFRLDVDDEIWQEDPGLGPQEEGPLPRWQADMDMQQAIVAYLTKQRCREERERLIQEMRALWVFDSEEQQRLLRAEAAIQGENWCFNTLDY
ncbi:hypothetical protein BKA62DRAFT_625553 [Auriculariales sp. MPI-PUGE-AT-0066]|nr:hypothetical protein BKA62DRAFT_628621 [Auriculariales sp. MPI-PUGE-AT-0066]KAH7094100.1 hypothetical protein BKA62DRAFT_625553 [Auriculariales sp. MPI-PUGE-AT-0066]